MFSTFTAKYTKVDSGYMGQLIEWPEVVTEGKDVEECREMLEDALHEMIQAYREQNREYPQDARCSSKYLSRYSVPVKRRDLIKYFEETDSICCARAVSIRLHE